MKSDALTGRRRKESSARKHCRWRPRGTGRILIRETVKHPARAADVNQPGSIEAPCDGISIRGVPWRLVDTLAL